jgi:hypothetical protein
MKTNLRKDCQLIFCHLFVRQTFVFWEEILIEQEKATSIKYRGKQRLVPRFRIQSTTAFADHSYSALAPAALILFSYACHGFCILVF